MDRRADRIAILIAVGTALCIAVICLPGIAAICLPVSFSQREREQPPVHTVSQKEAEAIALGEVKKQEGWSGDADEPTEGYLSWQVVVRRKPGPTRDWRWVTINSDRTIVSYEVRTEWLP
jgi:hypothetical protein